MTKKFFSKIMILAVFASLFGFAAYQLVNADDVTTGATVGNASPVFTVTPSDGGSDNGSGTCSTDGNPTCAGDNVTFTATAKDVNSDNYYLAVCKTDAVTVGAPPTCDGGRWPDNPPTATASDSGASEVYATSAGDAQSNAWYAYVCDATSCYPPDPTPDNQGSAQGTITFSGVPVDSAMVTVDSKTFEFDLTNGATCARTPNVCLDCSDCEDAADAAAVLAAAAPTANFYWTSRGAVTYVYAVTSGTAGNSIALAETGDTGDDIALPANLSGGDDENNSPFYVNHAPTFGTVTFTDTGDNASIEPGDTLRIKLAAAQIADADTEGGQDTINMYVCAYDSLADPAAITFNYTTNSCSAGVLLCSDTGVNPTSEDAVCDDTTSILAAPIAHKASPGYYVKVFIEDNHDMAGTGTNAQDFDVQNVVPSLDTSYGGGDGYINTDAPAPGAGGSDTVVWTTQFIDLNGDGDITGADGVFFDDAAVNYDCSADENDCYTVACSLEAASSGSDKEATGTDTTRVATCTHTVYFNANASSSWTAYGKPADEAGTVTGLAYSTDTVTNGALLALDLTSATIAYGTVEIGGTSDGQTTTIENKGNQVLDSYIGGTDMISGGNTIPRAQQKWHHTSGTFDWDAAGYALVAAGGGSTAAEGCADRNITVRNLNGSGAGSDESIYWRIRIPSAQAAGTYSGTNTFTATASSTCTDGGA